MSEIVVFGSINMDIVVETDEFPLAGQTVAGKSFQTFAGGKGANQCVAAARLGADVEMIGTVGNDAFGKELKQLISSEGIKNDFLFVSDDSKTGCAVIQINKTGQNNIIVIPLANYTFDISMLPSPEKTIKDARLVMLQHELRPGLNEQILKLCQSLNTSVMLNPAPARPLTDEVLRAVSYLTPNETELEAISGLPVKNVKDAEIAAKSLLKKGVKCVIVTLGKQGALVVNADCAKHVKGYSVNAVDTVAAGDCFNGAFASQIISGKDCFSAAAYANAAAALAVTRRGAIPSLPTAAEVKCFITANLNQ